MSRMGALTSEKVEFGPCLASSPSWSWPDFGHIFVVVIGSLARFGHASGGFGPIWVVSTKFGPASTKLGPVSPNIRPGLPNLGDGRFWFALGHGVAGTCPASTIFSRWLSKLSRFRPPWPHLANIDFGRTSFNIGPGSRKFVRIRPNLARIQPTSAQVRPIVGELVQHPVDVFVGFCWFLFVSPAGMGNEVVSHICAVHLLVVKKRITSSTRCIIPSNPPMLMLSWSAPSKDKCLREKVEQNEVFAGSSDSSRPRWTRLEICRLQTSANPRGSM